MLQLFFIKRVTEGLFDHYGIVSKEEKQKKIDLFTVSSKA